MRELVGVVALMAAASAQAGCEKDTDCKGDRICVEGRCAQGDAPLEWPVEHKALPGRLTERDNRIAVLIEQRQTLAAPLSGLIFGAVLASAAAIVFAVTGDPTYPVAGLAMGSAAVLSGLIWLGAALWGRSRVGEMIEALDR